MKQKISFQRLHELLTYDKLSGTFFWNVQRGPRKAGDVAGTVDRKGYIVIVLDGVSYKAHHLAWFYEKNEWPIQIDHKDLNKDNNSLDNLRLCSDTQNRANATLRSDNKSGYKGVFYLKKIDKWVAFISKNRKRKHLGTFSTPEEAHVVYIKHANVLFGEFARGK